MLLLHKSICIALWLGLILPAGLKTAVPRFHTLIQCCTYRKMIEDLWVR